MLLNSNLISRKRRKYIPTICSDLSCIPQLVVNNLVTLRWRFIALYSLESLTNGTRHQMILLLSVAFSGVAIISHHHVTFETEDFAIRVDPWCDNSLRVRVAPLSTSVWNVLQIRYILVNMSHFVVREFVDNSQTEWVTNRPAPHTQRYWSLGQRAWCSGHIVPSH